MAKRHRTRPRARRSIEAARRTPATVTAREAAPTARAAHRPVRGRAGYGRAAGAPSQALERAAVSERLFVVKDFRRLGIVVAIALALLVVSGVVEGLLLK